MADTITTVTTADDVQKALKASEEASYRAVKCMEELQSGERESSGEAYQELERLISEAGTTRQAAHDAEKEYAHDYALKQAANAPGGGEGLSRGSNVYSSFNKIVYDALQGKYSKVIFEPSSRVSETEEIRCENPDPIVERDGNSNQVTFKSTVYGPDEIINPLFTPPTSRMTTPEGLQDRFTTTTGADNAPLFIDYYNSILHQDVFAGTLLDGNCSNIIDVEHTNNIDIPGFGEHPTTVQHAEDTDITEDVPSFDERVMYATQWGMDTTISNRFIRGSQVPQIVSEVWTTLVKGMADKCNEMLTIGNGTHGNAAGGQPHGVYTAAQEAYQSGNSRKYENVNTANYGNDNRNRVQVDGDHNDVPEKSLDKYTEAFGLLDPSFHSSSKTFIMAHQTHAMQLLRRTAKGFETNDSYSWVNFRERDPLKSMIFSHLGVPIIHNPWLDDTDGAAEKKLFVMGDFNNYWVRRSRIEMFVSDHVEAKKDNTYLRLLMYLDGRAVRWSPYAKRVGPFVYGVSV